MRQSRRDFLKQAGGAVGVFWFPVGFIRIGGYDWYLAMQTYSLLSMSFEKALHEMRALRVRLAEPFGTHMPVSDDEKVLAGYRELLKKNKIKLKGYGVESFGADRAYADHLFSFAQKM